MADNDVDVAENAGACHQAHSTFDGCPFSYTFRSVPCCAVRSFVPSFVVIALLSISARQSLFDVFHFVCWRTFAFMVCVFRNTQSVSLDYIFVCCRPHCHRHRCCCCKVSDIRFFGKIGTCIAHWPQPNPTKLKAIKPTLGPSSASTQHTLTHPNGSHILEILHAFAECSKMKLRNVEKITKKNPLGHIATERSAIAQRVSSIEVRFRFVSIFFLLPNCF